MRRTFALGVLLCAAAGCEPEAPPAGATEATRIVALAPHIAEIAFHAGVGDRLVGVSAHTDFPASAAALPVVGDAFGLDQEALALLEPDLILTWREGTPRALIDALRARGYRVVDLPAMTLADVARSIEEVGRLGGAGEDARRAASSFIEALAALRAAAETRPALAVFYQIDSRPLYTVGGRHFVSEIVGLCGGRNVFAEIDVAAAQVSVEAVVERDPDVVLAPAGANADPLAHWRAWSELRAVRSGALYTVDAAAIARPGPRLVDGAARVCEALERARAAGAPIR